MINDKWLMINDFDTFRKQKGYSDKTIKTQNHSVNRFKKWCLGKGITPEQITYNQTLQFIDSERERGIANPSIIMEINSIRVYYEYLTAMQIIEKNIFKRLKIRQNAKKASAQTLSIQQLEDMYQNFQGLPSWKLVNERAVELHKRNVVLLGLMIYQGLTSGEIAKIEIGHINLMEGKIYIPSTRKSNARTLKLHANQILSIKTYLDEFKPGLLLFPTKKQSDLICYTIKEVKKHNPEIENIDSRQIRTSVIMNWLKTNNIRQVQYMAGHKKIKSTEQYRNQDLTDLSRQLELFHPLQ